MYGVGKNIFGWSGKEFYRNKHHEIIIFMTMTSSKSAKSTVVQGSLHVIAFSKYLTRQRERWHTSK